jgi:hypothetical protein
MGDEVIEIHGTCAPAFEPMNLVDDPRKMALIDGVFRSRAG